MSISATFSKCNDDPRTLGKTLTGKKTATCHVYEGSTVSHPKLLLKYDADIMQCNYVELPAPYNRKYFMSPPSTLEGGRMVIPCTVDVLESVANSLKSAKLFVNRAESDCDRLIVDDLVPAYPGSVVEWVQQDSEDDVFPSFIENGDIVGGFIVYEIIGGDADEDEGDEDE